jgi:hypothetical protein
MVKLLGIIDLLAASLLLAAAAGATIPLSASIFVPICLIGKACICLSDAGSIQDIAVVILIVAAIFIVIPSWILYLGAIFIGLKGLASLAA